MRISVLTASVALLIGGCATAPTPPKALTLTSTEWRLVEFVSPEESIGAVRPKPGEVYTLRLNPDGTVAAGLFCNRGAGHWSSPEPNASMGSISFSQMAVTQAACPPSQMERIAADFGRVVSFVIRDGRLHLNLKIDSGDYVWEPVR